MTNPYIYDRPITDRERFYSRRSEITRIYSRIAADRPQSVSIVGEPRAGKTSLLNWLCDPASQADYLKDPAHYVYLLLHLKDTPPGHPEAFFRQVDGAFQKAGQEPMQPDYDGFCSHVARLAAENKKLVLFCDDFHVVTRNRAYPLEFYSFLRSIANNRDVGYVTTSSAPLHKLCASPDLEESPFFNIFTAVNLRPFNDEKAQLLVRQPAQAAGMPFDEEADWVLDLAGPLPYLLQLTAGLAFEGRANGRLTKETLAEQAFKESREFLQLLWDFSFSPAQREVLKSICAGRSVKQELRYAAEDLKRGGYLKKHDDGYLFAPALLQEFVARAEKGPVWKRLFGG